MVKAKTIRSISLFFGTLFTLGSIALFAYLAVPRTTGINTAEGGKHQNLFQVCTIKTVGLKTTYETSTYSISQVCPWSDWILILGFATMFFTVCFLLFLGIRICVFSVKLLRVSLLLGLISSILLIISFIAIVSALSGMSTPDDNDNGVMQTYYSRMAAQGNAAVVILAFLTVLFVFVYEIWNYRSNVKGINRSVDVSRGLLPS